MSHLAEPPSQGFLVQVGRAAPRQVGEFTPSVAPGLAMKDSSELVLPLHRWEKGGLRRGGTCLNVLIPKQISPRAVVFPSD